MPLTASKLRENIYKILDRVLETGIPVEIERSGRLLKIIPAEESRHNKLDNLEEHPDAVRSDPEELVHMDWSEEWRP